ncbi:ribose import ATP-binding protein RbsA 2 [Rhizocola hellebori]|uniref:Ribose import ATP-binding protein RbsA 2 n=1 Tax=Rhizocola hellebori TaxID=1392758 RepID=A0A8J3QAF1_9ACTN|nr:sugar ABC transporter ATP-binding protein [Rhizocola hellebori]GIH07124.1 ribose import ATP-binding protein RbsA 2 [Rhizocola hellebori]
MSRLELRGVHKDFSGVEVLHGVDLSGDTGEVIGVVGANGAGKSTLIKILSGALPMSQGEMWMDGERVDLRSPHDAHDRGIRTVYQELSLVPELSVTENLLMGSFPRRFGLIDWTAAHSRAQQLLDRVGFGAINPKSKAGQLSVARQQMVEIAKALVSEPRVLVLDEPSAVLAGSDLAALFALVRQLRDSGVLVIYVSHRLVEVLELASSIVVIKDGRIIETTVPQQTNEDELIRLMAGRRLEQIYPPRRHAPGQVLLDAEGLQLRAGEIVGLFGLVGSGRSELAHRIFRHPAKAIKDGLAFVTEDRARSGLVLGMPVRDNISLTTWRSNAKGPFIDASAQRRDVARMVEQLGIRPANCAAMPAVHLSGGNQQKVVLAKWLLRNPRVLLLDEPTRGVDMATRVDIYRMVDQLARQGLAVLLISSELTEVIGATDRVLVMHQGRITGELNSADTGEDEVLAYAMGRNV